jgi:glycosyltransferase involved in cell wall biosynthesis
MRVLHVIPSVAARTGGPAVTAVELARVANSHGIESVVFSTTMGYPAQAWKASQLAPGELVSGGEDVDVRLYPVRHPYRLAYSPELRRALSRHVDHYDVVHIHSLYLYPQYAAATEAWRRGVPYVVCVHGALDPWLRRRGRVRKWLAEVAWQNRMLSRAAAIHFTLEEEAVLAADVARDRPRVILPNGVRWDEFGRLPDRAAFRERFLNGHSGPVVLFLGRLTAKKGLDLLIRAFAQAVAHHPDALLVIAGPDDENLRGPLQALAEQEDVGKRVVFTGLLLADDKRAALGSADVWALSSHTEAFTIAVIEALAAGLPVLVSPAVNLAREIERAGAGIVSDTEPEQFAGALDSLLDDERRRVQLGERAREFARRYDWDALAPRIIDFYRKVAR